MKKLVRIKLINWHLFLNQTIEIKGNSLVSGENGAGKSTFLDAIQYVLTGGKAKFNTAANMSAKRDIEGYVRCKLGIENKTYLRNHDVTSHIALEFFDEISFHSTIIGVIIEINKSGRLYERFYTLKNQNIEDALFIYQNVIRGYVLFKKYCHTLNYDITFTDTKEQTRKLFLDVLEIKNNKYIELIPKALSFRPIDELNKFVFDFLLNEKNVSIDELRQNVRSYRELEDLIRNLIEKETVLNGISLNHEELLKWNDKKEIMLNLINYCQYQALENKEKQTNEEIHGLQVNLKETQENSLKLEEDIRQVNHQIDSLNQMLSMDESYHYYQEIGNKLKEKENEKKELELLVQDMKAIFSNEIHLCQYIVGEIKKNKTLETTLEIPKNKTEVETIKKQFIQLRASYEEIKETLLIKSSELKKEKLNFEDSLVKINSTIKYLEQNQIKLDQPVERLKSLIEEAIEKKTQSKQRVYALCEIIEVNDETWRNALEGYLNTQRFDLIVDPIYFDLALNIYENSKLTDHIFGVGLVNTQEMSRYTEVREGSLATKIQSNYHYAKCYANMLLNPVHYCDNVVDLKNYKVSITKTCMVYKNYTARQIKEEVYKKPYIGKEAVKRQLINDYEMKKSLEMEMERNSAQICDIDYNIQRIKASQIDYLRNNIGAFLTLENLNREINELSLKANLYQLTGKVNNLKADLMDLEKQVIVLNDENKKLFIQVGKYTSELENKNQQLILLKQEKLNFQDTQDILVLEMYHDSKQKFKGDGSKILKYCQNEMQVIEETIKDLRIKLISQMNQFNIKYHVGFAPCVEGIKLYLEELTKIREYELISYEEKAREARINCEVAFKEQFIYKLRENMINAHQELDYLNTALKNKKFGGDEYEFIYKASRQPEYLHYYELIMSENEEDHHSLFTESVGEKNYLILKELFDKLVIDGNNQEAEQTLARFCDYRNYMSYDIKINHRNGESTYFSKVSREKSGGETQTPFYVVIAASFEQIIYDKKKRLSPACFVMFDEAFNNMDESRIQAMMEFYNQLNIQLMIAVPPQRVETIIPNVNTTLVVMKEEETSFIVSFTYEKKNMLGA